MRHRRSRQIYARRITEKERSATEEAHMNSLQQEEERWAAEEAYWNSLRQQQQSHQPVVQQVHAQLQQRRQLVRFKKKRDPLPAILVGGVIIIALLIMGIASALLSPPSSPANNFVPDPTIYASPTIDSTESFCSDHTCTSNYPNGKGSTIECKDGTYSHSGGRRGACSYHGGETYP